MEAFGPFPPKTPPEHPDDKLRSPRTDGRIAPQLAELVLALVHVLVLVLALVLTLVLASTSTSTSTSPSNTNTASSAGKDWTPTQISQNLALV
jgi:hypothetical protein